MHKAMSRWDGLKSEKGEDRERFNNGPRLGRNKRWTSSNSKTTNDVRRQQKYKSTLKDRQQFQRQHHRGEDDLSTSSNTAKLQNLRKEYDAAANSLKSQLRRHQSGKTTKDDDKSIVIENLLKLLTNNKNFGRFSTANEQPCSTEVFMTLLNLLGMADENGNFDDNDNMGFLVAKTVESCLKLSLNGIITTSAPTMNLSKPQVHFAITTLSSQYNNSKIRTLEKQSSLHSSLLVAIALLVRDNVCELPPESTAQRVVGIIFIPYVSSLKQSPGREFRSTTSSSSSMFETKCICEATIALLQNPSHASAILAPLVEDVSIRFDYGTEQQTINPLRIELLSVLLKCLEMPHGHDNNEVRPSEEQAYVCHTLSASIDAIRKLERGNENNNDSLSDVDVQITKSLQKFIIQVVTEYNCGIRKSSEMPASFQTLMVASLGLLRALISSFPKAMTGTGWKLIIEGANRIVNSTVSQSTGSYDTSTQVASSFLPLTLMIHNNYDTKTHRNKIDPNHLALTMDCLSDFILVLPWNKWLKQSGPGHDRQQGYNTTNTPVLTPTKAITSGLFKTVVDALSTLIGISENAFCKCRDPSLMKSLGRLIKSLMLEIPYCDVKLVRAGEHLWEEITKITLNPQQAMKEKQKLTCDILMASSGGTVTPQGHLREMSVPARTWYLRKKPSSDLFLDGLLDSFESNHDQLDQTVKILSSVLRTLPDVALQRWDAFCKILEELNTSSSFQANIDRKDLMRMEVLESFMMGRKDFDVSFDLKHKNDTIITDLDGILLRRWNQNGLQRCINIYSAFRSQDWVQLDQIDGRLSYHFENVVSHCHNSNAKIREGAAKAIGEFCTQHIGKSIEETKIQKYNLLANKVHSSMLELCGNKSAGTRSMSIFSLGNLASALRGANSTEILQTSRLHTMHRAILSSFNDSNDKVVKNAIRSVGHTSVLLTLSMRAEARDEHFATSCELLVETIDFLTQKLWNTLHVALNEEQKTAMTWKERSAAKKHGWGACHSLGLVFEGLWDRMFEESTMLASACSKAVQCLVLCPCYHTALNEKVVLAAMAALCHPPLQFLAKNNAEDIFLGDALKTSILILESTQDPRIGIGSNKAFTERIVSSKLAAQNKNFLLHLLNSASFADATAVLADDQTTTQTLGTLYSWMVERSQLDGLSSSAFKIFALALQQPGRWSASVGFEQQFTSRALQKCKQERNAQISVSTESNSSPAENTKDEDEADEL